MSTVAPTIAPVTVVVGNPRTASRTSAVAVATAMSGLAAEDPQPKASGIYIEHGTPPTATNDDRMEPTIVTDTQMQGGWKMAIGGRPSMVSSVAGTKAERRLTDPQTTFLFVFPANGGFPTTSGKAELYSAALEADGLDPLPAGGDIATGHGLQLISGKALHFMNSGYGHMDRHRRRAGPGDTARAR